MGEKETILTNKEIEDHKNRIQLQKQASEQEPLTEEKKDELSIRLERILGKPPHNMLTEIIVKELVEKVEEMQKELNYPQVKNDKRINPWEW